MTDNPDVLRDSVVSRPVINQNDLAAVLRTGADPLGKHADRIIQHASQTPLLVVCGNDERQRVLCGIGERLRLDRANVRVGQELHFSCKFARILALLATIMARKEVSQTRGTHNLAMANKCRALRPPRTYSNDRHTDNRPNIPNNHSRHSYSLKKLSGPSPGLCWTNSALRKQSKPKLSCDCSDRIRWNQRAGVAPVLMSSGSDDSVEAEEAPSGK